MYSLILQSTPEVVRLSLDPCLAELVAVITGVTIFHITGVYLTKLFF